MGRHKKEISPSEMKRADNYAFNQCHNATICEALGWCKDFIEQRKDLTERFRQKRAQGKAALFVAQGEKARNGDVTMQIWCGKQHLEQSDKSESKWTFGETPLVVVIGGKFNAGPANPDNPA